MPADSSCGVVPSDTHRIPAALIKFGVACYADNAYRAAGPTIAVPFRRRPRKLSANQKKVNRNYAVNTRGPARAGVHPPHRRSIR